ncbi:MAG: PAS domain-containing protein, partial [Actinobacteria bacterium]|nr:PAS domain-containing protein [Actinomycetota bacterium]
MVADVAASAAAAETDLAGLKARAAALRQASSLPKANRRALLDAALAELDAALAALDEPSAGPIESGPDDLTPGRVHSDRRLLHAVFTATPTPLYVVTQDGTVLRANSAAGELLGTGPGYATGKSLATLIEPVARAALA